LQAPQLSRNPVAVVLLFAILCRIIPNRRLFLRKKM
jgi:hypothetical protein